MLHRYVLYNDRIVEAGSRELSAGQVGLLSGWGVFTTLRVAAGVLFAFHHRFASADPTSVAFSGELLAMVVIGGLFTSTLLTLIPLAVGCIWTLGWMPIHALQFNRSFDEYKITLEN